PLTFHQRIRLFYFLEPAAAGAATPFFFRPFPPSAFGGATRRWIHRICHALQTRIVNTVYSIIIRESCLRAVPDSSSVATTMKKRAGTADRKSTRLNSSHVKISYAVFCLKKKNKKTQSTTATDYRR